MSSYNDLSAYLKNLAVNHTQVGHSDQEKHFFHCELTEILSGINSKVNFPAVFMADYDYSFIDNDSDNHLKKRSIALVFIDHCQDVDDFDQISAIYSEMEQVADDWLNRMYEDKLERGHHFLKHFELDEISAVHFSTVDNNFGIYLPISITCVHDIRIDAKKWNDR